MPSVVMQTTIANLNNVPAFLMKLWRLVEDEKCDDLICWSEGGTTFYIRDQSRFSRELLPLYFKHNNMASFIRQLNMYGFRKVVNIEQGGLRAEKDEYEFQHMYFLKGHECLLELIKRKAPIGKGQSQPEEVKVEPELVTKMLLDVKQLHGKQENLDVKLSSMKGENEVLWREVANLRQQHKKQQQIVNKLIQFLLSLVHPKRSNPLGVRRKIPLMLNDVSHSPAKSPRLARSFSVGNNVGVSADVEDGAEQPTADVQIDSSDLTSPAGPIIHDITDTFDAQAFLKGEVEAIPTVNAADSPVLFGGEGEEHVAAGLENIGICEQAEGNTRNINDFIDEVAHQEIGPTASTSASAEPSSHMSDILVPITDKDFTKNEFEEHLDGLQLELDTLKDFLSGSGCTIDPVSLLGVCSPSPFMQLFSNEDNLTKGTMDELPDYGNFSRIGNGIVGTELAQYHPSVLNLGDDDDDVSIFNTDAMMPDALDDSLFGCVDDIDCIDDKPDDQAVQVSIPDNLAESLLFSDRSIAVETPISAAEVSSTDQQLPLGIATAGILTSGSVNSAD